MTPRYIRDGGDHDIPDKRDMTDTMTPCTCNHGEIGPQILLDFLRLALGGGQGWWEREGRIGFEFNCHDERLNNNALFGKFKCHN